MKYLNLSSKTILQYANDLYEEGYISYPFSNCDTYPDDFDFQTTVRTIALFQPLSQISASLRQNINPPLIGKYVSESQLPVYPTKVPPDTNFGSEKLKLYQLIARHFLATCSQNATFTKTVYSFSIGSEIFKTTVKELESPQWLNIFNYKKYPEQKPNHLFDGEILTIKSIKLNKGKTLPKTISEIDIIKMYEENGLMENAKETINCINALANNGLIKRNAGSLRPTELGISLALAFEAIGLNFEDPYLIRQFNEAVVQFENTNDIDGHVEIQNRLHQQMISLIFIISTEIEKFKSVFKSIMNK
ncbi:DNA topoisomerase 3-beta-1 [Histomonas meleagridis]|uniref:DNA topoisomerase 3-beta-1 n=1 Tax=Histomonas meleagridis TaxID=135588 RepID=UPI00355A1D9F|nr:DNA topoisomerase 3-beta-1 [Histomonas meleagridis]KAH0802479.1 DNA topoisomerase 3-beta-1 [Histomonas meleagridis]